MANQRVYLVDGSNLLYRAYHAIRGGFRTVSGLPTNAAFGFLSMLLRLQKEEKPDAVVVVFDPPGPTRKHQAHPEYKANREKTPDDLIAQIPYVHRTVRALGSPLLVVPGEEADDVIGTLAARFAGRGDAVTIVTGDKDFCQLVGPSVRLLDTMSNRETTPENVAERMGVPAERVVDLLSLTGDAVDNIPGVPGLGPKGAAKLLADYGTLEEVAANAGKVSGKRGEALREHLARVLGNRPLVTIETALDLGDADLDMRPMDRPQLAALLRELEFFKFLRDLGLEGAPEAAPAKAPPQEPVARVATPAPAPAAPAAAVSASDYKIPSTWVAVAVGEGGDVAGARERGGEVVAASPDTGLFRRWPEGFLPEAALAVGHGLKGKKQLLASLGLAELAFDTEIAAYLLSPGRREYALEALLRDRGLSVSADPGEQARALLRLAASLGAELEGRGLLALFRDIEMPLVGILADMERAGVLVDREQLDALSSEYEKRIATLEDELFRQAGETFNPRSPKDLSRILFEVLKLPALKKTATGYSTDASVLEELALSHDLPATLLQHRNLTKLKSSFIDALPKLVSPADGRIHASFHQTVAATGRLSSSNPNLQNIPIRGAEGRRIREAFIAAPGYLLVSADYSQIEFRILAHLSGDKSLREMFMSGRDIHAETASRLFDVGPFGVTDEMRRQAKTVNFGILYGMSAFGLARQLGLTRDAASRMIKTYFARFPGVRAFLDGLIDQARTTGETRTLYGRLRPMPELASRNRAEREAGERLAVNSPIQGTAADVIKRAMIDAVAAARRAGIDGRLVLQVHDELVFEVRADQSERARDLIVAAMEGAARLAVPLKAEAGVGPNWHTAH